MFISFEGTIITNKSFYKERFRRLESTPSVDGSEAELGFSETRYCKSLIFSVPYI